MSAAALIVPYPIAIVRSGGRGPLTALWLDGVLLAVFGGGQTAVADRVAQLLERHGLADVPDNIAEVAP